MDSNEILFGSRGVLGEHLDLRKELQAIFYGSAINPPEAHPVVVRFMKRDSASKTVRCKFSTSAYAKQNIHSPTCPVCLGEGSLWDEKFVWTYRTQTRSDLMAQYAYESGDVLKEIYTYFFEYDVPITLDDTIIEVRVNSDGTIIEPVTEEKRFKPIHVQTVKADYGRVEFIQVLAEYKPL